MANFKPELQSLSTDQMDPLHELLRVQAEAAANGVHVTPQLDASKHETSREVQIIVLPNMDEPEGLSPAQKEQLERSFTPQQPWGTSIDHVA